MKTTLCIEFNGDQTDSAKLIDMAKEAWKSEGHMVKDLQTLNIYFKPEERSCYCVINGDYKCDFRI